MGHRGGLYREPDVAVLGVVVVALTVKIGGHDGYKVGAELPPIGLGKLEACNFCHRVPFVGRLQRAGEQQVFGHQLRSIARKN